ncbi:MAG: hypothetical protein Q9Q40_11055 [Acidobacteriota bacterium]|nr:hypothetical protein [Acidobacteriota bacterium]
MDLRSLVTMAGLLLAGIALAAILAGPSTQELEDVAQQWFRDLQQRDFDDLAHYDLHAPAERSGRDFEAWKRRIGTLLDTYERQRDQGSFEPDPEGRMIARAAMLGAGTYWETVAVRGGRDAPVLRIHLNFGYGEIYYGDLPRGATVYLMGWPLGKMYAIRLGTGEARRMTILDHLDMDLHFRRVPPAVAGDSRYKVERLEWIESSAEYRTVEWLF